MTNTTEPQAKKLEILIVEDTPKHLANAQETFNSLIQNGQKAKADFVSTYLDAKKLMGQKKYSGIVSDIFFPFSVENPNLSRHDCYEMLKNFGINYPTGRSATDLDIKKITAADEWVDGRIIPPTGILIARDCIKDLIPIVFCTDTYHHGYSTQPVFEWSREYKVRNIPIIDSHNKFEGNAPTKDWLRAYEKILEIINLNLKSQK